MSEKNNFLRNTLVVAAGVTAAVHGALELTGQGHGPRLPDLNPFAGTEVTTTHLPDQLYGDKYPTILEGASTGPSSTKVEYRTIPVATDAVYSREFDKDSHAEDVNMAGIPQVLEQVSTLQKDGWSVLLRVRGQTSAEDESEDKDGGVQTPSDENFKLGIKRENSYKNAIRTAGLPDSVVVETPGPHEDSLDDKQVATLQHFSDAFGYANVKTLIDSWNVNPESVPTDVNTVLTAWLGGKHRGVSVEIIATRTVKVPGEETRTQDEICIQPIIHVIEKDENAKPWDVTIPYGVPIMMGALVVGILGSLAEDEVRRSRRHRLYAARNLDALGLGGEADGASLAGAGLGGGGALLDTNEGDSSIEPASTEASVSDQETVEQVEEAPVAEVDSSEPERKKRRKWPWLIPVALALAGTAIHACEPKSTTPKVAVTPATPPDPCHGLPPKNKVVGTKVTSYRNGQFVDSEVTPS